VHSGLRSSRVPESRRRWFRHNDAEDLGRLLEIIHSEDRGDGVVFLALESLYSMDGDMAPLPYLLDEMDRWIPKERQCVVLDEAHSTGVYGYQGRGIAHALGEYSGSRSRKGKGRVGVRLMTFGKAVGCSGGKSDLHFNLNNPS
jgi:8-amino-7-oxononanoate synthase